MPGLDLKCLECCFETVLMLKPQPRQRNTPEQVLFVGVWRTSILILMQVTMH